MGKNINTPEFTIKLFTVPVKEFTKEATEETESYVYMDYEEVNMDDYLISEEKVDTTCLTLEPNDPNFKEMRELIRDLADEIKRFNDISLKMAKFDKSITTANRKVLCTNSKVKL